MNFAQNAGNSTFKDSASICEGRLLAKSQHHEIWDSEVGASRRLNAVWSDNVNAKIMEFWCFFVKIRNFRRVSLDARLGGSRRNQMWCR